MDGNNLAQPIGVCHVVLNYQTQEANKLIKAGGKKVSTKWVKEVRSGEKRARFVGRESKWQQVLDDLFSPASGASTDRYIDYFAAKQMTKVLLVDARNAYFHAEEKDVIFCTPPKEYLKMLAVQGKSTDILWRLR